MKMWVAREKYGLLVISETKPKYVGYWYTPADAILDLRNSNAFPEVTFDNSPMEVELVLKK